MWNQFGRTRQASCRKFPRFVSWKCLPRCDICRSVASHTTLLDHPRSLQLGWEGISVAATSTLCQSLSHLDPEPGDTTTLPNTPEGEWEVPVRRSSESSHPDPNRATTIGALLLPETPVEEASFVPAPPACISKDGSEDLSSRPAKGITTRIGTANHSSQTHLSCLGCFRVILKTLEQIHVRNTTWTTECEIRIVILAKRRLAPFYRHRIIGNKHLPVFIFDFSGPFIYHCLAQQP